MSWGTKMLSEDRAAGSRMHVLDWLDGGAFIPSINAMLRPTELFVPRSGKRMPAGWDNSDEACLGRECDSLIGSDLNDTILHWWLANPHPMANIPNWDLVCQALYHGNRSALVLVEAKAYVTEFTRESKGQGGNNPDNRKQISQAIDEVREALSLRSPGVKISADYWYQFANRIAFTWKLASHGIPSALVYLGFLGDKEISTDHFGHYGHWCDTALNNIREIFPASLWERRIDINGTPLWFLIRSLPCIRQSPRRSRDKETPKDTTGVTT